MTPRAKAISALTANTAAFAVCFAVWMMYGVLVTFLVDQQVYTFSSAQMGWLIGIPVLTGSVFRLPAGMLADRYGGRPVYVGVMLIAAVAAYLTSYADGFWGLVFGGLGFGIAGASFAVGVAYTSVWFPPHQQGTALGIFGVGNTGAALTAIVSPQLLAVLTQEGTELDRWRMLPRLYALLLVVTAVLFWLFTFPKKSEEAVVRTLRQRLEPLESLRVWRFGLYYFLLFGGFVALSQWLIPYYVNVYAFTVVSAGLLSSLFSLPSGLVRALGGWLADRFGARAVMYWVLGGCTVVSLLLVVPRMDIQSPGQGVMAARGGTVTAISEEAIEVEAVRYPLRPRQPGTPVREGTLVWPTSAAWQEPVVQPGDVVPKRALLARGITHIYFQANIGVFTGLVFALAIVMGIGMAAVYKHIPTYFPRDVGTVGGTVGVLGGLGGFVDPLLFGYLVGWTGIWTTNWMLLFLLSLGCLVWMHVVIRRMLNVRAPDVARQIDERGTPTPLSLRVLCPVHEVQAQVRVFATAASESVRLAECSLWTGEASRAACERHCVVIASGHGGEATGVGRDGRARDGDRGAPRAPVPDDPTDE
ncbi:MAG: NarK/NasA family nitrate transporter [Gemmatimonadetes bacterium]|nr:NarK/NasA family nitrate transporter [Gemmatimonadota bacterium]